MVNREDKNSTNSYNHLKDEKSPYLIQHAQNPVDWYPWGREAFEKAKDENKPIFLSIGYSTCHWCHVMARESFQDEEIAQLINQVFVAIKVDREEHPDVDSTYMMACQIMTGRGGWPLTVFLTPDLKPFFAGTYFPKDTSELSIGLRQLILNIKDLWTQQDSEILKSAEDIATSLNQLSRTKSGDLLSKSILKKAYDILRDNFHDGHGGFGSSQKFPSPNILLFMLHYWERTGQKEALQMVEKTLEAMKMGGIWDHLGFGFHRYTVDPEWLIPHFEKMLYDQALLILVYLEAYQATGNQEYQYIAEQSIEYVLRDMTSEEGGFYSAEDAESEGSEGKFYLWTKKEIEAVLGPDDSKIFCQIYNIQEKGNYLDMAVGSYTGSNIIHLKKPVKIIAQDMGLTERELQIKLETMQRKLFQIREKRIHPGKDDKILTDWNGLMIAALARAGRTLNKKQYTNAAIKAAEFVKNKLHHQGKLMHRYREGEVKVEGYLEDYAFLIWGLLELYEATLDSSWLKWGSNLNEVLIDEFHDPENGGFYLTSRDREKLLMRKKEVGDGSLPSGNGVVLQNLIRLSTLMEDQSLNKMVIQQEKAFAPLVNQSPTAHAMFLLGVMDRLGPFSGVVIAGERNDETTQKLIETLNSNYLPRMIFSLNSGDHIWLKGKVETYREKKPLEGKATAYICQRGVCGLPTTDADELLELLSQK
jgi:uncharacterized protein